MVYAAKVGEWSLYLIIHHRGHREHREFFYSIIDVYLSGNLLLDGKVYVN